MKTLFHSLLLFLLMLPAQIFAQSGETPHWQMLQFVSGGKSLALTARGKKKAPVLAPVDGSKAQQWKITALGSGFFRLTNRTLGNDWSLDIQPEAENAIGFSPTGNFSGQFWKFLETQSGGKTLFCQKLRSQKLLVPVGEMSLGFMPSGKVDASVSNGWKLVQSEPITGKDLAVPKTSKKFGKLRAEKKQR